MKHTAVEWLADNIMPMIPFHTLEYRNNFIKFIEQAKEMEKEQIRVAYMEGAFEKMRHLDGKDFMMPTEYYNETFKTE